MPASANTPPSPPIPVPAEYNNEKRVRKDFWPKLKRVASRVPGVTDLLALYFYMNSSRAPLQHKLSILATLAYFIMPVDLIPDILGPLGYTDDVWVALGLIKFIGSDVMRPYRSYARKWMRGEAKLKGARPPESIPAAALPAPELHAPETHK